MSKVEKQKAVYITNINIVHWIPKPIILCQKKTKNNFKPSAFLSINDILAKTFNSLKNNKTNRNK